MRSKWTSSAALTSTGTLYFVFTQFTILCSTIAGLLAGLNLIVQLTSPILVYVVHRYWPRPNDLDSLNIIIIHVNAAPTAVQPRAVNKNKCCANLCPTQWLINDVTWLLDALFTQWPNNLISYNYSCQCVYFIYGSGICQSQGRCIFIACHSHHR